MARIGAPWGIDHGKATIPFTTIAEIRNRFNQGASVIDMAVEYKIPEFTIRDWVAMKTRISH